jgi:hypothetical protein
MSGTRTRRIIAVFGGSEDEAVLEKAEELGRAIAEWKQILLTGGTGPALKPVKNRAIRGAHPRPWIGVDRKKSGQVFRSSEQPVGFSICSDLDHYRNYLEAHMCDAAIGLDGGDGTKSELTCALALKRPVAFVGDDWTPDYDLDNNPRVAINRLVDATFRRFAESDGSTALKDTVTEKWVRMGLGEPPPYMYFESQASAADVVDWIKRVLPDGVELQGSFPTVRGHEGVAEEYRIWLAEQEVTRSDL